MNWSGYAGVTAALSILLAACSSAGETRRDDDATAPTVLATTIEDLLVDETSLPACADLWQQGDPIVEPAVDRIVFDKVHRQLKPMLGLPPEGIIVALGSGQSVHGRLTVTVAYRDPDAIAAIEEIDRIYGEGQAICIELPPIGYYDQPLEPATWELLEHPPNSTTILIEVGGDCGGSVADRMQPPSVTERTEAALVEVLLEHALWGVAQTLECSPPPVVVVELAEPLGDRTLAGCGRDDCHVRLDAAGTPVPVPPPVPRPLETAGALEALLTQAGFADVAFDHSIDPTASAIATWDGDVYTFSLYQGDFRPDPIAGRSLTECDVGGVGLDDVLPDAARAAIEIAADC